MSINKARTTQVLLTMVGVLISAEVLGMHWVSDLGRLWLAMAARVLGV